MIQKTRKPLARYCSATICPRTRDMSLPYVVPASELSQDATGHHWCNHCAKQCVLMDWAANHGYPFVRVQGQMRYAVADGPESWFLSIAGAQADMVQALYETLIEQKRAPLWPITEEDENVQRILKWLKTAEERNPTHD